MQRLSLDNVVPLRNIQELDSLDHKLQLVMGQSDYTQNLGFSASDVISQHK